MDKKLEHNLYGVRLKVNLNIQRALYLHIIDKRYIIAYDFTKK